jgi:single-strand DNA-binding protein
MSSFVSIIGNLTRDPELKRLANGGWVCDIGVAVNKRWIDRQTNEQRESTSFFDAVCYGDTAQNVAASLTRGARVIINGYLQQDRWETDSGDSRSKVKIQIQDIGPTLRFATVKVIKTHRDHNEAVSAPNQPAAAAHAAATMAPSTIAEEDF